MPINNSYDEKAVIEAIAQALETFYANLIAKIDELNIQKIMKRKNPYLYRAKAMQNAAEIVESVLTAFVSSSEETIFGNCFFEPIAIAASNGNKALDMKLVWMQYPSPLSTATFLETKRIFQKKYQW